MILYGNGYEFMNVARFKGHSKFFHNSILKTINTYYGDSLEARSVDESYTTKTCSLCSEVEKFVVSEDGHRYVFCKKCRKGTHRDRNAARNILQKHSLTGAHSPVVSSLSQDTILRTTVRTVDIRIPSNKLWV